MSEKNEYEAKASQDLTATGALAATDLHVQKDFAVQLVWTNQAPSAGTSLGGEAEISTLTFEAKSAMVESEYVVIYDTAGLAWAIAGSKQGIAEITTITAVADVSDSLDGTYFLMQDVDGSVAFWIDTDDSGTTIPAGASAADRAVEITTIATDDADTVVGGLLRTAIGADSKFSTAGAGADCIVTQADFKALTDAADGDSGFGFVTDTQGSDLAVEPTGAIYTAIPAARKAQVDLSGETTDIEIAAAFEVAFDALSSVPFATDDTAADGTMIFTQTLRGPCTIPASLLEDDGGAGGVSIAETNQGVAAEVDITADSMEMTAHGYLTGIKGQMTTTGTLPAGLSTSTDYFVIKVDVDNIQLASSLANALAGTQIDLTDTGADGNTHTFTATALASSVIKMQESIDGSNWTDIADVDTSAFTASGAELIQGSSKCNNIRPYLTMTAGQISVLATYFKKE